MQVTFFYLICLLTSGIISLSQAIQCGGSAKYKLTFKGEWTKESHPQDFPNGAHFSSVVGCSHNTSYVMWRPGQNATKGVQLVAERGRISEMNKEIDGQISLKTALNKFEGSGISNGVGIRIVTNIEVNTDYPLVSAISMIAPSPDWFVGVRDYSLCDTTTGKWIDKRVRHLPLYDSGTDSDKTFVHSGTPTIPPVPIFLITKIPEDSTKNQTLKPFGTFTFEKTFDSMRPTSSASPTNQATATTANEASSVQHLGSTSVAATTTMKTSMNAQNEASSVQHLGSTSVTATTTMKTSMNAQNEASSVQHLGSTSVAATTTMKTSMNAQNEASSVQHLGSTSVAAMTTMKTSMNAQNEASSVQHLGSTSVAAMTTMKTSTTQNEASSVQHLGVFVFLKLIILNLFFINILN